MRMKLSLFTCIIFQVAHELGLAQETATSAKPGSCNPCKEVLDGPATLRGFYSLVDENESRCDDGCCYEHEVTLEKYCFDSDGKYDTNDCPTYELVHEPGFDHKKKLGYVTQGPVGVPGGGESWNDATASRNGTITGFRGWSAPDDALNGIQVRYGDQWAPAHGFTGEANKTCDWPADKPIETIAGRSGAWLDVVQFWNSDDYPNRTTCGPFGGLTPGKYGAGYPYIFKKPYDNCEFAYLSGWSGLNYIRSLSFTWLCK